MFTQKQTRQTAWIHGLPGDVKPGGIQVEVLNFKPMLPGTRQMSVNLAAASDTVTWLRKASLVKTVLPRLSLVVRIEPKTEQDVEYRMTDAHIVSVQEELSLQGAVAINISFNKFEMVAGVSMQPGPPPTAPLIQASGSNKGWICKSSTSGSLRRASVEVADFTPPCFNGRLAVTFGAESPEIQRLLQAREPLPELILVLPDRATQRYVEFKLWDAWVTAPGLTAHQVVFESDLIECLTGST